MRNLSKGMTQKLGLAACFLAQRDLYVLDEPMSGLDPAARVAVKSLLSRLAAEGRTLFFTSHVLADVEELCASIAVLDAGRVRFRGTPAELAARYAETNLERAFMRCIRDDRCRSQRRIGKPALLIVDDDPLITDTLAFALGSRLRGATPATRAGTPSSCCASSRRRRSSRSSTWACRPRRMRPTRASS